MSAGICGKRSLGFEDLFGSPPSPSHKRSRRSRPTNLPFLLAMFPSIDREVVESVLNSHHENMDETIKSLHTLCLRDESARDGSVGLDPFALSSEDPAVEDGMNYHASERKAEETQDFNANGEDGIPRDETSWVNLFVEEMTNASNWDDVRGRTTKFLEAFEKSVMDKKTKSGEEIALRKDQVQYLLRENQILKKAVAIQHGHQMEHEEKLKEVQQLKHMIGQYQEQVRTLEMNNYTLKVHLERSQGSNSGSMPGHFHPDIF